MLCSRLITILLFTAKRDVHWWASKLPASKQVSCTRFQILIRYIWLQNLENIALKRSIMFSGISVAFNSPRDEEMLLCDSFFAPLKHKYLESSIKKKIINKLKKKKKPWNSRSILSKFSLFEEQNTSNWIVFKRLRPATVTRPRDVHVANYDLSVSSQHSIEIHSQNVVISRLEMDNCLQFLQGRKLILLC